MVGGKSHTLHVSLASNSSQSLLTLRQGSGDQHWTYLQLHAYFEAVCQPFLVQQILQR